MPWPYKFAEPPLCRLCGKPIAKYVESIWFYGGERNNPYKGMKLRTRAEVERLVNGRVVSVHYHDDDGQRLVYKAGVWDGESYEGDLFCTQAHAVAYARFAVDNAPSLHTAAYAAAARALGREP